jgi:hypothetical protein
MLKLEYLDSTTFEGHGVTGTPELKGLSLAGLEMLLAFFAKAAEAMRSDAAAAVALGYGEVEPRIWCGEDESLIVVRGSRVVSATELHRVAEMLGSPAYPAITATGETVEVIHQGIAATVEEFELEDTVDGWTQLTAAAKPENENETTRPRRKHINADAPWQDGPQDDEGFSERFADHFLRGGQVEDAVASEDTVPSARWLDADDVEGCGV